MARKKTPDTRERRIEIVERQLMKHSSPRLQVSVIFAITGLAGFLTSFVMLQAGITTMWLRYAVAILLAYGVFLLLLRLWLWMQQRGTESQSDADLSDLDIGSIGSGGGGNGGGGGSWSGGGGSFGGGGATGNWGEGVKIASLSSVEPAEAPSGSGGSSFLDIFSADLDEGILIVIALVAILAGVIASFYIIYIAPGLLAEILVDGALLTGLYNRVKDVERRHWLGSAVRRTIVPVLIAAVCFTAAGYAMQLAVPEARSIGEVWRHFMG